MRRHRISIRLTRTTTFTRLSAVACVAALALAGAPGAVAAQTTTGGISGTRQAVDATASAWFAAQRRAADLDQQIATISGTLDRLQPRVDRLRKDTAVRAVELYESNPRTFDVGDVMSDNPLDIGRQATLIAHANADGQAVIDALGSAINDLDAQRSQLRQARADQDRTLADLSNRRRTLDGELATLEAQAHARQANEAAAVTRADETATTAEPTRSATVALKVAPAPSVASTPAAPPSTGQTSSHHDDPFLVCTRARESSGNYGVVSSAGYYGAYQFSPTTWNVTASHAGRLDLVGVLPSSASVYDQDEMAWTLYQWQGTGPWGGRC